MPMLTIRAIIAALPTVIEKHLQENLYKVYITDSLRLIGENTAKVCDGGSYIKIRYADIIDKKPKDNRSSEEIIDLIKSKLAKIGGEPD